MAMFRARVFRPLRAAWSFAKWAALTPSLRSGQAPLLRSGQAPLLRSGRALALSHREKGLSPLPSAARWGSVVAACLVAGAAFSLALVLGGSPKTANAQPPAPHPIVAGMDCLSCHGQGEARAIPSSHAGYPVAQCANCHKSVPSLRATPAPQGPDAECLTCHGNPSLTWKMPGGDLLSVFVE